MKRAKSKDNFKNKAGGFSLPDNRVCCKAIVTRQCHISHENR